MTILPINPADNASPAALLDFLTQCRALAAASGRSRLVSITLEVPALDPLAVLESIFEPTERHFYVERPAENFALAGAEAVISFSSRGAQRFADCQRFIDATLADAIVVGDQTGAFSGLHFFTAFSFFDDTEAGEPFDSAGVFVPRWQVALANGRTTAVANFLVTPDADLAALAEKVWRARQKFGKFDYGSGGTGILPVGSADLVARASSPCPTAPRAPQTHGQDARATRSNVQPGELHIRQGAYLPHWTREGAIYTVTFRLADSLPQSVLQQWLSERQGIIDCAAQQNRPLSLHELERLAYLHSQKIEAYLDSGAGDCHLRRPEIASLVRNALLHFDGAHYELHAWCVMPNHVHVIVRPLARHTLESILHSWKSFTARTSNKLLGRTGDFWQSEYYDHLIRDEFEYSHALNYLAANPEKAGLKNWQWIEVDVRNLEKHRRQTHGQDARATQPGQSAHAPSPPPPSDYRAAVSRALEFIAAGEFRKIVLARTIDFSTPNAAPLHPLRVLNTLRERFTGCYSFSLANGLGQSFIGASPERLLRVRDKHLLTEALAGSAPRGTSASEDAALGNALLHSEKDLREQRHVLDSILRRLAPLGLKLTHPENPDLRKLANVQHLHTPVEAPLPDEVRVLDVLSRLHPTPAVGGTPRETAVARIRELEGFPRGLYAGAIGWIDSRGSGEFFVGLRSALINGSHARLYAGAGIVAGSSPEKEFEETEIKSRAIRDALLG